MILQSLMKYYESLAKDGKVTTPGWCQAKVSYMIDLNEDGTVKQLIDLKQEKEAGKKKIWVPINLIVPEMLSRSSGISANFLCDNAKYFLGIDNDGVTERSRNCFQAAKAYHLSILGNANGSMAKAICAFFKTWNLEEDHPALKEHLEGLKEGGNIIFEMKLSYTQDDGEIRELWQSAQDQKQIGSIETCLVTGEKAEIARIHRTIKGGSWCTVQWSIPGIL